MTFDIRHEVRSTFYSHYRIAHFAPKRNASTVQPAECNATQNQQMIMKEKKRRKINRHPQDERQKKNPSIETQHFFGMAEEYVAQPKKFTIGTRKDNDAAVHFYSHINPIAITWHYRKKNEYNMKIQCLIYLLRKSKQTLCCLIAITFMTEHRIE